VEQALDCLYHEKEPSDPLLMKLQFEEWSLLGMILDGLMREKRLYDLH
jgi:hypothetical protein